MRRLGLVTVIGAWLMTAGTSAAPQSASAQLLMARARTALGGDLAFTSFKVTGSIKTRNAGESGRFEITCDLPSRFMQFEDRAFLTAGESVAEPSTRPSIDHITVRLGFEGDKVIYERSPYDPRSRSRLPPTKEQRQAMLPKAQEAFVNLTIGLFASSFPAVPLTFTDAAGSDAERTVMVNGAGLSRALLLDNTGLPQRFGNVRYADYRDISGRKVPSRVILGTDEWIIEEFKVLK